MKKLYDVGSPGIEPHDQNSEVLIGVAILSASAGWQQAVSCLTGASGVKLSQLKQSASHLQILMDLYAFHALAVKPV